jgi:hypothetical protein
MPPDKRQSRCSAAVVGHPIKRPEWLQQSQLHRPLFDHLVGTRKQKGWNRNVERSRYELCSARCALTFLPIRLR